MLEKYEKRLEDLKKTVKDPKVDRLLVEMVKLEADLDELEGVEKYRHNPNNPAQIKVDPAFYAYHKTLGAYKEIVRVLLTKCEDADEESPLRAYLKQLNKNKDTEEID
jgi:hypothetical protein